MQGKGNLSIAVHMVDEGVVDEDAAFTDVVDPRHCCLIEGRKKKV